MELETLEVLLEVNTKNIKDSIGRVMPDIQKLLSSIEGASGQIMRKTEKNLDMSDSFKRMEKTLNDFTSGFSKQLDRMEKVSKKKSATISTNMAQGFKTTRTQAGKEVDLMVKDINAKMNQAKAKQAQIAELTAKRSVAVSNKDSGSIVKYDNQIATAEQQMIRYRNAAMKMSRDIKREFEQVPQSLDAITKSMDQNEPRIETMRRKIAQFEADRKNQMKTIGGFGGDKTGFKQVDTPDSFKTLEKIQVETAKMNKLISENDKLQQAYAQTEDRSRTLRSAVEQLGSAFDGNSVKTGNAALGMKTVARSSDEARSVWSRFGGVFTRVSNNIAHGARQTGGATLNFFTRFNRSTKQATRNTNSLGRSSSRFSKVIGQLSRRILVYGILYKGIMALATGMNSALKTNDQYASSLNQIKVNMLTAFYPIYQAILPAINALMSALAKVTGYMASFVATMFGTTYSAAKKGAEGLYDNVQAMNETGKGASKAKEKVKELQNSLMGFDEINKIGLAVDSEDDTDSNADKNKVNFGVPDVQTPKWLTDFAARARDIFSRLFAPIKAAWDKHGQKVMDAWKYALGEVWGLAKEIGKSFMKVWTNGTGERFIGNLLQLLALVLNIVGDIAKAFKDAWKENERGTKLIQSIFDMFNSLLEVIIVIGETFREVWNDGTGERIAGNILETFTKLFEGVAYLGDNFKKAWLEADVGKRIFEELLGYVDLVFEATNKIAGSFKDWARDLNFTPMLEAVEGMLSNITPIVEDALAGLSWIFDNILLPITKWALENAIPAAIDVISAAFGTLDSVVDAMKPALQWLWDEILKPIADWTGGVIVSVLESLADALEKIGDFVDDHGTGFSNFVVAFGAFAATLMVINGATQIIGIITGLSAGLAAMGGLSGVLTAVGGAIGGIVTMLGGPWAIGIALAVAAGVLLWKNWDKVKEKADQLKTWISDKWSVIKEKTKTYFGDIQDTMVGHIKAATGMSEDELNDLAEETDGVFGFMWGATKKAFPAIKELVADNTKKAAAAASEKFAEMKKNVGKRSKEIWDDTKTKFSDVNTWITDKTDTAKRKGSSAFYELKRNAGTYFGNVWSDTKEKWGNVYSEITNKSGSARTNAINAFSNMKTRTGDHLNAIKDSTKTAFDKITSWSEGLGGRIAKGLRGGIKAVKSAAAGIANGMVSVVGKAVNGVIKGINWTLSKVGAGDNKLKGWTVPTYAKGTDGHPGGPALVNDGYGSNYQEAYQLPTGEKGLFPKQRNMLVNLPKGSKVLSGPKTSEMYGNVPRYAKGIGDWMKEKWDGAKEMAGDIWSYAKDPSKLVDIAISKYVNLTKAIEPTLSIAKGGVGTIAKEATNYVKGFFDRADGGGEGYTGGVNFNGLVKTDHFGWRTHPITGARNFHKGVDYAGGMGMGHPINAQTDGKVTFAGWNNGGYGNAVQMRNGIFDFMYAHLSKILVSRGDNIKKGQRLGLMGSTGMSTGPHIHYEVYKNGQPIDPEISIPGLTGSEPSKQGKGVERWKATIQKALRMNGLSTSPAYVNAWMRQIQTESGGNEKAVQSDSVWDVNTAAGNPARGLLQTIPQTFNAYKHNGYNDIYNGFHNALAAINYAKNRYGASGMLDVIGHGHGYENGGMVTRNSYRVGEGNKKELIIPLERKNRALELLEVAKSYLGVEDMGPLEMPQVFVTSPTKQFETPAPAMDSQGGLSGMADKIAQALSVYAEGNQGTDGPTEIVMEVQGDKIGEIVIKHINKKTKQTGIVPIKI